MPIQKLERIQRLPASLSTIWDFISSPDNLKKITPEYMSFEIQGNAPKDVCRANDSIYCKTFISDST